MNDDKIIRVNMTDMTISIDDYPSEWKLLGGRALSARILLNECDPSCDPLGPDNVFVLAPGILSGTSAPTSGRLSVGCKSPLTGGIKEANVGGNPGQDMMKLGYRAIVVFGQPADRDKRWGLEVTAEGVKLVAADDYAGMWNYACCEKLFSNYPKTASAISIGPAGEMMLKSASVACTDKDRARRPARHAARGGVGAVMGSKCLKWVLVDAARIPARKAADAKAFVAFNKSFSKDYLTGGRHDGFKYGTSACVPFANMLNTFPYKNRTEGQNPEFEQLDGARINESFATRGGKMHACLSGCIVKCSNIVHDKDGNYLTSALEFETLTLLGSCCAINNWEDVADLDRLCDELGLDTIEIGAAIAILMDSGGMEWGDAEAARNLLKNDIAKGTDLGITVGNGAVSIGTSRNHHRIPVAKGQALPAWDPRPLKAAGVTYASSAMGADHTAGLVINTDIGGEEAVIASQHSQIINAVIDSSGFCLFLCATLDEVRNFYSLYLGEEISREQIADLGWQCMQEEWEFNDRAGFTQEDDDMAACLREEGIGPDHSLKFDIPLDLIAKAKIRQPMPDEIYSQIPEG
ncbi:MAG: aldehyde ferredoxin oxidoreductase N-terminal domain-containing protein [Anaerolineae bacterium]|nr:aldehyde ferredoxin oxidoreductase N-terminal domain-containing protein [Anaerolineae bacterium]